MNLLFIYEVDYLKKVVYDMHILAEAMSVRGHNIYAIDYESMWDGAKSQKEIEVSRVFPPVSIRLMRPWFLKVGGLSRLTAFVSHYFAINKVIKDKKIDAIVLYSVPTNGLQAIYWARKYGIPVIFRSLDALNQLVAYPMLRSITKYLEKAVYSRVDMVATLTPKLSEYVCGLGAKKAEVLPMTVDTNAFRPFKSDIGKKWGLTEDDLVIMFMGTLFGFSGLDTFISSLPQILRQVDKVKFLIVGDGEQRPKLASIIKDLQLWENVIITGFQPYEDMPSYINRADVCILPFQNNKITRDIFPGKVVQYLACAKPVVATKLPGMESVLKGAKQGVVYVQNACEMVESVSFLLGSAELRQELGESGLGYTRQIHSSDRVAEKLEEIIRRVV